VSCDDNFERVMDKCYSGGAGSIMAGRLAGYHLNLKFGMVAPYQIR